MVGSERCTARASCPAVGLYAQALGRDVLLPQELGFTVSEATVSRYMPRPRAKPPSQTWRTFLHNHMHCAVGIDFFVVPTATFRLLYVFVVL